MLGFSAFTVNFTNRTNTLITNCGASDAFDPTLKPTDNATIINYQAIWDTGATSTVITSKVAKELGIKPTGIVTSSHAGGSSRVNTYLINAYLPNNIIVPGVRVVEAVLAGNIEMLIGMDIISQGDFAFTNHEGRSCFTFRIPSMARIDYVTENKNQSR